MDTIIRETLRPFGITRNYRGYPQTVRAIALVLEDESRLLNVTEEIYEVVAHDFSESMALYNDLFSDADPVPSLQRGAEHPDCRSLRVAYKPTASGQNGGIYADGSAPRLPVY